MPPRALAPMPDATPASVKPARRHERRPRRHRSGTARFVLAALCGAVLAAAWSAPASAHAAMVGSDPEDGSTVATAPESVSATFSETLDAPSTEIAATGPDADMGGPPTEIAPAIATSEAAAHDEATSDSGATLAIVLLLALAEVAGVAAVIKLLAKRKTGTE